MAPRTDPSCVFCKIAKGDIPSHKVYEDDATFAFLDIKPLATGHALVIPKSHAARYEDMTPEESAAVGRAIREVTARAQRATGAAGATIAVNNGPAAGQEVPHVHVHVVPRREGDGVGPIHGMFVGKAPSDAGDLAGLAKRMRE